MGHRVRGRDGAYYMCVCMLEKGVSCDESQGGGGEHRPSRGVITTRNYIEMNKSLAHSPRRPPQERRNAWRQLMPVVSADTGMGRGHTLCTLDIL